MKITIELNGKKTNEEELFKIINNRLNLFSIFNLKDTIIQNIEEAGLNKEEKQSLNLKIIVTDSGTDFNLSAKLTGNKEAIKKIRK
jgi:hypothetical protein